MVPELRWTLDTPPIPASRYLPYGEKREEEESHSSVIITGSESKQSRRTRARSCLSITTSFIHGRLSVIDNLLHTIGLYQLVKSATIENLSLSLPSGRIRACNLHIIKVV